MSLGGDREALSAQSASPHPAPCAAGGLSVPLPMETTLKIIFRITRPRRTPLCINVFKEGDLYPVGLITRGAERNTYRVQVMRTNQDTGYVGNIAFVDPAFAGELPEAEALCQRAIELVYGAKVTA